MVKKSRKPHRYKKRKPIYRYRIFWLIFLFLIVFISLNYFLFFSDFFQIKKINIDDLNQDEIIEDREVAKEEIRELIDQETRNKVLFFPEKNIFFISLIKTKEKILEKFPQIAQVTINRKLPDSLNVLIKERECLVNVCFPEQNCFVLDEQGVVFETRKNTENLVSITDQRSFDQIVLGQEIIKQDQLFKILEIDSNLKNNLNLLIKETIISSEKLTIITDQDWQIYFDLKEDTDWQLIKLRVVLEEKIPEQERENLEYIELRFGNFANPKYKD